MNRPWSIGQYLDRALKRLGHEVQLFNYRESDDVSGDCLKMVDALAPQFHLIYKGELFVPETIEALKRRGIYTILWHPDVDPAPPPWLLPLVQAHDFFFTMTAGHVARYQEAGARNVAWLSEGIEPSCYLHDPITPEEQAKYGSDVALVGNVSNNPAYVERGRMVARLLREGFDVKWWGTRIPHKLKTLHLRFSKVGRAWGGEFVWNERYAKVVHSAKIFLARDAYPDIYKSMSNRIYIAIGNGAFYLTYYTNGLEEVFEPDRELVVFRDHDEMVQKVRYYLEHDDERRAIAQAGQARVLQNYTYAHRFEEMFRLVAAHGGPDATEK